MAPLRDPVRNIVYSAQAEDLASVIVDGEVVMRDRVIPGANVDDLARAVQAAAERMWPRMNGGDWAGRGVDELSPQTFPAFRV